MTAFVDGRFSHPVATLNASLLSVNNGLGKIEGVSPIGPDGQLCGTFQVMMFHHLCFTFITSSRACFAVQSKIQQDEAIPYPAQDKPLVNQGAALQHTQLISGA